MAGAGTGSYNLQYMKILIDMNLSPVWAEIFASHDIEAVHWSKVGAVNAVDSEIMEFAQVHGYTILTHDLDYSAILAGNHRDRPSIIQLRTGSVEVESHAGEGSMFRVRVPLGKA
jgi:predicted nuclease of predicted toxin-antitoxin system